MSRRISVGQYVRSRRERAGLTIRGLSDLSGLSTTLIFNIEAGMTDPKLGYVEKLAKAFKESPMTFLGEYYSAQRQRD